MRPKQQGGTRIRGFLLSVKRLTCGLWNRSKLSLHDNTGPYAAAWLVSWQIPRKDDLPLRWEDGSGTDYVQIGVVKHLRGTRLYPRPADAIGFPLEGVDGLAQGVVVLVCTRDAKVNMDLDWTIDLDLRHLWGGHAEVIAAWDAINSGWKWQVVHGEACNSLRRVGGR
ncbi:hypothetical protein V501_09382 [Pseudogymnoascus sp. VKM F-4519 (FW-2642)]|nr:hypothetical protein V501_09382 [Pseudogymnoascus sp. VKM F-4519 (FW-2642)]